MLSLIIKKVWYISLKKKKKKNSNNSKSKQIETAKTSLYPKLLFWGPTGQQSGRVGRQQHLGASPQDQKKFSSCLDPYQCPKDPWLSYLGHHFCQLQREQEGLGPLTTALMPLELVQGQRSEELGVCEFRDRNRCSQVALSQNPQGPQQYQGFIPRYSTIFPADYGEFLRESDLSLLHPERICYLLLGLGCLFSQLGSFLDLLKLFVKILHQLLLCCQINFSKM